MSQSDEIIKILNHQSKQIESLIEKETKNCNKIAQLERELNTSTKAHTTKSEENAKLKGEIEVLTRLLDTEKQNYSKIKELELKLKASRSLSGAVLVRDTLDGFRKKILVPKYMSGTPKKSGTANDSDTVRNGYIKFLEDKDNKVAVSLNKQLVKSNIPQDVFINQIMDAITKMNRIIHTCADNFKSSHSLDDYLLSLKEKPRLDNLQQSCIELIAACVP